MHAFTKNRNEGNTTRAQGDTSVNGRKEKKQKTKKNQINISLRTDTCGTLVRETTHVVDHAAVSSAAADGGHPRSSRPGKHHPGLCFHNPKTTRQGAGIGGGGIESTYAIVLGVEQLDGTERKPIMKLLSPFGVVDRPAAAPAAMPVCTNSSLAFEVSPPPQKKSGTG